MKKIFGISNLGYAIILVIIIAIAMILSTPMIKKKKKNKNLSDNIENQDDSVIYSSDKKYEQDTYMEDKYSKDDFSKNYSNSSMNVSEDILELERRLNSRVDNIEQRQNELKRNLENKSDVKDAYICSIEGFLDSDNNVVSLDSQHASSDLKSQKFVFVCQYK